MLPIGDHIMPYCNFMLLVMCAFMSNVDGHGLAEKKNSVALNKIVVNRIIVII